jgi:hypothetical protein
MGLSSTLSSLVQFARTFLIQNIHEQRNTHGVSQRMQQCAERDGGAVPWVR